MSRANAFLQHTLLIISLILGNLPWVVSADSDVISLSRMRVIFMSSDKAQTVSMQNHGSRP